MFSYATKRRRIVVARSTRTLTYPVDGNRAARGWWWITVGRTIILLAPNFRNSRGFERHNPNPCEES
jgi:hypothetical protein